MMELGIAYGLPRDDRIWLHPAGSSASGQRLHLNQDDKPGADWMQLMTTCGIDNV